MKVQKNFYLDQHISQKFIELFSGKEVSASQMLQNYMLDVVGGLEDPKVIAHQIKEQISQLNEQKEQIERKITEKQKTMEELNNIDKIQEQDSENLQEFTMWKQDENFKWDFGKKYRLSGFKEQGKTELEYFITVYKPMLATLTEKKNQTE